MVLLAHGTALHLPEGEKVWTTTPYLKGWITGPELCRAFGEDEVRDYQYSVQDALAEDWSAEGKLGHAPGCGTYRECTESGCGCSCHD